MNDAVRKLFLLISFQDETPEVYRALVAELSHTLLPTTMMGITLIATGICAFSLQQMYVLLLLTVTGGCASLLKIILILIQRRRCSHELPDINESHCWELCHAIATGIVSSVIGGLSSVMFLTTLTQLHLLATALLFGYCAGVSSRLAVRPLIACAAMSVSAIPTIICSLMMTDRAHHIVTIIFIAFLLGGIHSVIYIHQNAVRNITLRLDMESLASKDPLTGLANRLGLRKAFNNTVQTATTLTIHYLDLDGFKKINDKYGHATGDELLIEVANRLKRVVKNGNTVARIGGDEFVIISSSDHDENNDFQLPSILLERIQMPFELSGATVSINGSIGSATASASSADLDGLLMEADEALYRIKRDHKEKYETLKN